MENRTVAIRLNSYGQELYAGGDQVLAMEFFQKSVEIDPSYADGYNSLGVANMKRGEIQCALVYVNQALNNNVTAPHIVANAKKIQEFCCDLQALPRREQINFILNLQEKNDTDIKKGFQKIWDKAWYERTLVRWENLQKLVQQGPIYSANKQQSFFEKNGNSPEFRYVGCPVCQNDGYKIFYHQTRSRYPIAQCSACGFLYRNPTYRATYIPKVYNRVNLQFLKGGYSKNREKRYYAYLKALEFEQQTAGFNRRRLLDVGCGYGLFLQTLQHKEWERYGLDFARDCVDYARKEYGLSNVFAGNLEWDSFEENYFDAVTLWSVAAHLETPLEMFQKIHRVLRPGGILLIYTVDASGLVHKKELSQWNGFHGNHLIFFSPDSLSCTLSRSGFETTRLVFDQVFPKLINGEVAPEDVEFFRKLSQNSNLGNMMAVTCRKV